MNNEYSRINYLKRRWAHEDAVRDRLEELARRKFWEQEANQLFLPIENYLTRVGEVLSAVGGSLQVDVWEHLGDQKLRRLVKVKSSVSGRQLALEFTFEGVSIFYCDKRYRFLGGVKALLPVLTSDVEQFFTSDPTQFENADCEQQHSYAKLPDTKENA